MFALRRLTNYKFSLYVRHQIMYIQIINTFQKFNSYGCFAKIDDGFQFRTMSSLI